MHIPKDTSKGTVIVCFQSPSNIFMTQAVKTLKAEYPVKEDVLSVKGTRIFSLDCQYSMEDELYPLLKRIKAEQKTDRDLVAAFGLFLHNCYTEKIVLYQDIDYFHYDIIERLSEEEKDAIKTASLRFRRRCINRYNEEIQKAADKRSETVPAIDKSIIEKYYNAEQEKLSQEDMLEREFIDEFTIFSHQDYESYLYEELESKGYFSMNTYWGYPNKDDITYLRIADSQVYNAREFHKNTAPTPLYMPFEQFVLKSPDDIKKHLTYGWYIKLDDNKILDFASPYETEEEKKHRNIRDVRIELSMNQYYPLLFPDSRLSAKAQAIKNSRSLKRYLA